MKVTTPKTNNFSVAPCHVKNNFEFDNNKKGQVSAPINFTSGIIQKLNLQNGKIAYTNAKEIINSIDDIFGQKAFSEAVDKAKLKIQDNTIEIPKRNLIIDLAKTIKYPFVDLPRDLIISGANFINKNKSNKFANYILNTKFIANRVNASQTEKNINFVSDVLDEFLVKNQDGKYLFDKCKKAFKEKTTANIANTSKNYSSRDERTLNRMVTATVSAIYSGWDFFNISMLQKNDSKEAKKSQKSRMKQELTRMMLSAGTTFVTLGALDKYIKNRTMVNALVIAMSALISEVASRIFNGTPIVPLSPEEAKKYAQKKHIVVNAQEQKENGKQNEQIKKTTNFKGDNSIRNIFIQFASKDGTFAPLESITIENSKLASKKRIAENKQLSSKQKKRRQLLISASLIASLGYLVSKALKGEYGKGLEYKKIFGNINPDELNEKFISKNKEVFKNIHDKYKKRSSKYDFAGNIKKLLTQKKTQINLENIEKEIKRLADTPKGIENKGLFDEYLKHIDVLKQNNIVNWSASLKKPLATGVYEGFSKIFKLFYNLFSIPGRLANFAFEQIVVGKKCEKNIKTVESTLKSIDASRFKKEMEKLNEILFDNNKKYLGFININKPKNDDKTIETITKNVRNFLKGSETGELAHISRTMVTLISTYFFVNDYTNKVLIESAGRSVEEAKEERNERIAHKLSNFVINGTLMNLFNSVFKTQLNNSLPQAAAIAAMTETTNEFLVRKSICQPVLPKKSREEIIKFEEEQINKKGPLGAWSRLFKKITGKKNLTQKAGIKNNNSYINKKDK